MDEVGVLQIGAAAAAAESLSPVEDLTIGSVRVPVPVDSRQEQDRALSNLNYRLTQVDKIAHVYRFSDVNVQTKHWLVEHGGALVSESRYLIHDVNLGRDFARIDPAAALELPRDRLWILGMNYAPGNYWHWHAQSLPAIVHALAAVPRALVNRVSILCGPLAAWQRDGLGALGLGPEQIVEVEPGKTVRVRELFYSELLGNCQLYADNHPRRQVRSLLMASAATGGKFQGAKRLFVSRGDSSRRPLTNEHQLLSELEDIGFEAIVNSDLSLAEQVQAYSGAEAVVAPHGAGSTNVLFVQPGTRFLEAQQLSHVNAGPLSLTKVSSARPEVLVFPDDGGGQASRGWSADVGQILEAVGMWFD